MRNLAFFAIFALSAAFAAPAMAYDSPVTDPVGKKVIETTDASVQEFTESFNMKKLVWADVKNDGQIVTLQYMPEDLEDPTKWTRMLEITVYGLSGEAEADKKAERKLIQLLETQYKRIGDVREDANYEMNEKKDIGMYLLYQVNPGTPQAMTAAGVFLRITDKSAAYIQLNARGRPLKKSEATLVHKLVNPSIDPTPHIGTP